MKQATWSQLIARQQHVMLAAIYLRNSVEDFHVKNLSDVQMKELNKIVRQSLYEIVSMIEDDSSDVRDLSNLVSSIPDYWEIPEDDHPVISESTWMHRPLPDLEKRTS